MIRNFTIKLLNFKILFYLLLFLISGLLNNKTQAQIPFNNPSFEGTCAQCGSAPPGWTVCAPSPDILPGCFGVNGAAQNGSTYAGFCTGENIGQMLGSALVKGQSYSFTVYLRYDPNYANGSSGIGSCNSVGSGGLRGDPGKLQIFGGTGNCVQTELLYTSPTMTSSTWTQFTINFTPVNNNYSYIMLYQPNPGIGLGANICVDNLSMIVAVPIQLISFDARSVNDQVEIKWSTASEKNNDTYVIEKSFDGLNFKEIGITKGESNSITRKDYLFLENGGNKGTCFYRLKMKDLNGLISYTRTVALDQDILPQYSAENIQIEDEGVLAINWKNEQNKSFEWEIHSLSGQAIQKGTVNQDGKLRSEISIENLEKGFYILNLFDGYKRQTFKILR